MTEPPSLASFTRLIWRIQSECQVFTVTIQQQNDLAFSADGVEQPPLVKIRRPRVEKMQPLVSAGAERGVALQLLLELRLQLRIGLQHLLRERLHHVILEVLG